ncbi:MAG: hypothetical protein JOZ69_22470 [Myxococcales bacterium]|nr:hypothetical protein [Myxococcales bacterium]
MTATPPTHPETQAHSKERPVRKTQTPPKERRVRVYPRLDLELQQRLAAFCAAKGITVREGIEEAVRRFLDGSVESEANIFGQLRKIALALEADRDERQKEHRETHRAVEGLSEALGRFVRMPNITEPERAGAGASAPPRAPAAQPPLPIAPQGPPRAPAAKPPLSRPAEPVSYLESVNAFLRRYGPKP